MKQKGTLLEDQCGYFASSEQKTMSGERKILLPMSRLFHKISNLKNPMTAFYSNFSEKDFF
jgi:hypothetical protein